MRVEGGESIQADCDCWTDSESPSLARSPLARQASWPLPQSLRLLHPRIVEGLSLSLLFASLSALTFPIGKRERVVSHESASRETVGGFPRVDECCCAGSIFSPRWPAGPGRVVPAYKSLSPNPPLLPVRSTSPSITLSTQARTPNNLP
jgi:hypothetical protein